MSLLKHAVNFVAFSFGKEQPITGPLRVHWDLTDICNSKCKHCDRWKHKKNPEELTTEEGLRLLEDLKNIGVRAISFAGAEPLLRKDIFDLISHAVKLGFSTSMNTNALLLNKDRIEKLANIGLGTIILSIDGNTEEIHDFIRGVKGSLKKNLEVVKTIKEVREKLKKEITVQGTIVANSMNVRNLYDTVKMCKENGFDKIVIQPVHFVEWHFNSEDFMHMKKEDIPRLEEQMSKIWRDFRNFLSVQKGYFDEFKTFFENPESLRKYRMSSAFVIADIRSNGDVVPDPVGWLKLGNLHEKSFKEIWFSDEAKEVRRKIKNAEYPINWFSCVQPISLFADDIKHLRVFKIINPKFLKHAISKV